MTPKLSLGLESSTLEMTPVQNGNVTNHLDFKNVTQRPIGSVLLTTVYNLCSKNCITYNFNIYVFNLYQVVRFLKFMPF